MLGRNASAFETAPAVTDVHKVRCNVVEITCKDKKIFYVGHISVYMLPIHCKIGQGMRIHVEKLLNECGKKELNQTNSRDSLKFTFSEK